ncbi:MAG: S53 family peptidase, partial [Sciscionella sp.]
MNNIRSVTLAGSERSALTDVDELGAVPAEQQIELTIVLPRRAELPPEVLAGGRSLTRDQLSSGYGADPDTAERVRSAMVEAGLRVTGVDLGSRRILVVGQASEVAAVFGTEITMVRDRGNGIAHRHRTGALRLPAELDGLVLGVLGLDNRPQVRAGVRIFAGNTPGRSYTPLQLGAVYRFPQHTDGTGQTVAIIELGGGYTQQDLDSYFSGLTLATPHVSAVGVDGSKNDPGTDTNVDTEVALDIEVAGALAPKASYVVYFAPNTDKGFLDAISQAAHADPAPAAMSISWGQSEDQWTQQGRTAMDQAFADAAALGVTVCAAAGDNGSSDNQQDGKPHVDFPASSPNVLGCGGTSLLADATGVVTSETVWNSGAGGGATGGGVSDAFPVPSWQTAV